MTKNQKILTVSHIMNCSLTTYAQCELWTNTNSLCMNRSRTATVPTKLHKNINISHNYKSLQPCL